MKISFTRVNAWFDEIFGHAFNLWFYSKAFLFLVGILLCWGYMPWMFLKQSRLQDIQESGAMVDARVVEVKALKDGKSYGLHMKFAYQLDGVSYTSIEVHPKKVYNVYEKDEILVHIGIDSIVALQVNREHPERAVYFIDDTPVDLPWSLFSGAVMVSLFWLGGFFYWKRLK